MVLLNGPYFIDTAKTLYIPTLRQHWRWQSQLWSKCVACTFWSICFAKKVATHPYFAPLQQSPHFQWNESPNISTLFIYIHIYIIDMTWQFATGVWWRCVLKLSQNLQTCACAVFQPMCCFDDLSIWWLYIVVALLLFWWAVILACWWREARVTVPIQENTGLWHDGNFWLNEKHQFCFEIL